MVMHFDLALQRYRSVASTTVIPSGFSFVFAVILRPQFRLFECDRESYAGRVDAHRASDAFDGNRSH